MQRSAVSAVHHGLGNDEKAVIVTSVLQQHVDDATALAEARNAQARVAYANLQRLHVADHRLLAHLQGLRLAGDEASSFYGGMRGNPSAGGMFVLTARALEQKDGAVDELIAMVQALPETLKGLLSAFGWVDRSLLKGTVAKLLAAGDPFKRMIGVAACGMHRVDPRLVQARLLQDPDPGVRARAYRTAGEIGLLTLASDCAHASRTDDDPEVKYWAAWSAALLGEGDVARKVLDGRGSSTGAHASRSFRLNLQMMPSSAAHRTLQDFARDTGQVRRLIEGSGIAGDPSYVPWLIQRMVEPKTSRLAGEAFTLITGENLGPSALDRPAPEHVESGPTDDPNDPDVDMDPDDGLSWPDLPKIEAWWAANSSRFQAGTRYFMGKPVTREHCIDVLKNGYQRQRILAAHYLCLLEAGTPLFNTSAPAWRQQKQLASMA
jgi:uncharacterized protein (TIGR02270 family)